jgi:hypothetical protein
MFPSLITTRRGGEPAYNDRQSSWYMPPVNERSYHCIIESVEESQPVAQENAAGHELVIVASSKRSIGRGSNLGQANGKRQAGKARRRCLPAIAEESMGVPIGVRRR